MVSRRRESLSVRTLSNSPTSSTSVSPKPPAAPRPGHHGAATSRRHSIAVPFTSNPSEFEDAIKASRRAMSNTMSSIPGSLTARNDGRDRLNDRRGSIPVLGSRSLPVSRAPSPVALPKNPLDEVVEQVEELVLTSEDSFRVDKNANFDSIPDFLCGSDMRRLKKMNNDTKELGRKRVALSLGVPLSFMDERRDKKYQDPNYNAEYFNQNKKKEKPEKGLEDTIAKLQRAEQKRELAYAQTVRLIKKEIQESGGSKQRRDRLLKELEAQVAQNLEQTKAALEAAEKVRVQNIATKQATARGFLENLDAPLKAKNEIISSELEVKHNSVQQTQETLDKAAALRNRMMKQRMDQAKELVERREKRRISATARIEAIEATSRRKMVDQMDRKLEEAAQRRMDATKRRAGASYYRDQVQDMLKNFDF